MSASTNRPNAKQAERDNLNHSSESESEETDEQDTTTNESSTVQVETEEETRGEKAAFGLSFILASVIVSSTLSAPVYEYVPPIFMGLALWIVVAQVLYAISDFITAKFRQTEETKPTTEEAGELSDQELLEELYLRDYISETEFEDSVEGAIEKEETTTSSVELTEQN